MCLRASASTFGALSLGLLCLALPAMGNEPVSVKLKEKLLTNEEISELCRASIKHKYDMVSVEDEYGSQRQVPRCVANYEAMRAVAESYLTQEESAKSEIASAISSACGSDPNQASCLEAGRALASKAADLHDNLSQTAEAALERLAGGSSVK